MGVFHVVQRSVWRRAVFVAIMLALATVMYVYSVPTDKGMAVSGTRLLYDWVVQGLGGRSVEPETRFAGAVSDEPAQEPVAPVSVRVEPLSHTLFAEYKLERERSRAQQMEQLEQLLATSSTANDQRRADIVRLLQRAENELQIEVLLRARGWTESLAVITDSGVIVVIPETITETNAATIGNVVAKVANVPMERITISDSLSLR